MAVSADKPHPRTNIWRELLVIVLTASLLAVFARTFIVRAYSVPTDSMTLTLRVGDNLLLDRFGLAELRQGRSSWLRRPIERGDVVVFRWPTDPDRILVKRCAAVAGDVVEIIDKRLIVNGIEVDESRYLHLTDDNVYPSSRFLHESLRTRDNYGPITVADGSLFFLGDNRDRSNDSRFWGTVPSSHVLGRPVWVYWSRQPAPLEGDSAWARSRLRRSLHSLSTFFSTVSWSRAGLRVQ